ELGKGTGLGLSTAIGIIKNHGGFLNVSSEQGKGTAFNIYLPAIDTKETRQAEVKQLKPPPGQGKLILVVDDETSIREITKATLQASVYRGMTAGDGTEAIAIYVEHQSDIDLVITDMTMPIMDGPATVRALRRLNPALKIIVVSGLMINDKVAELSDLGVK